ncbi:MAG: asparagine synthase C-terminal domain-containing protein [Promethearchaeota archaeon]
MKKDPCIQSSRHLHFLLNNVISEIFDTSEPFGVLFSGGLDSSVITAILSEIYPKPFQLFVAGVESAKDIAQARIAAASLNLPLTIQLFTIEDAQEALPTILSILRRVDVLHTELAITHFFAARCAANFNIKTLFSGQGADELFGGYAKHEKQLIEADAQSVITQMATDFHMLQEETLPLMTAIASHFNLQLVLPYLDQKIKDFSSTLTLSCKITQTNEGVVRKRVLRLLAHSLNLPSQVVNAPKRALQYGSGANRILENLAAEYWLERNPTLSKREACTHTRVENYLKLLMKQKSVK